MKPLRETWKCYTSGLKRKEGAPSQGIQVASGSWQRQETILPGASKRNLPFRTPLISPQTQSLRSRTRKEYICVVESQQICDLF